MSFEDIQEVYAEVYGRWVGQNYGPIFRHLWTKDHQTVNRRRRDRSLQCRFPTVDILLRSGDICDRSAKSSEIAPEKHVFPPQFLGEDPQILDLLFKIAPISYHVAKFRGDRPRDRGLALNKKEKKERNSSKT